MGKVVYETTPAKTRRYVVEWEYSPGRWVPSMGPGFRTLMGARGRAKSWMSLGHDARVIDTKEVK